MDKLFIPINIGGNHWVLVVAYMQTKRIIFLDSLGRKGKKYMLAVMRYIIDEMKDKLGHVMTQVVICLSASFALTSVCLIC